MLRMDTGFFKRGKTWQIRRAVPSDLQAFLGRKEILKSLRTGDEAEAIRRYRVEATEIDAYFERERDSMLKPEPKPTEAIASIRKVSAFFSYCMKTYDECTTNPMSGQADRTKQGQAEDRDPFSIAQLKTVFSSPLYTGAKSAARWYDPGDIRLQDTAKFWVFLIGLFSGARLGEIVQLHVADIKEDAGIPYFDFSKTAPDDPHPKFLKTSASSRLTPIHNTLVKLGFLEFVKSRRKSGEVRLFPDAIKEDSKKFSNTMSKLYARLLDSLGISGHKEVFHSTRHNFKDACRSAEIPEEISKALMGHE